MRSLIVASLAVGVVACVGEDAVVHPASDGGATPVASEAGAGDGGAPPPPADAGPGDAGADALPDGDRRAFVTSALLNGKLGGANGGLGSGDKACTDEARAAGRTGTFHALIARAGESAFDRIGLGPWKLADGSLVPPKADFTKGAVRVNLDVTGKLADGVAWTGSDEVGGADTETCNGWTDMFGVALGRVGEVGGAGTSWLSSDTRPCSDLRRIYCFED
jgi:hypothetical protein